VANVGDWRRKYRDAKVAGEYDLLRYRGVFRGTMKQILHERTLRRALKDVPKGGVVLDIPCGTGRFTNFLLQEGYRVIGADISPQMIGEARRKVEGKPDNLIGFQTCEVERLPFPDRSIDCTLTVRFLHLVPAEVRPRVFQELKRVSRGKVVLCVNVDKYALKHVVRRIRGKASPLWMSQRELKAELAAAGLTVERIHSKFRFLSTLWVVVARA
jgi:ubiquinone/menaquinone biosynthesis C-methylase UbiE